MTRTNLIYWFWVTLAASLPLGTSPIAQAAPYPSSSVISDMRFDFSRLVRRASGSDNWPLTWGADDNQYSSWGDGFGFDGGVTKKSLGYSRIEGPADNWSARDVFGSENAEAVSTISGKSYAILSVGGVLYSFVSPGSASNNLTSATLYKSTDGGHSWIQTPVVFTESLHGLALPGFLQFGRDYSGARDAYVYAYWTKVKQQVWGIQTPGEIMLTRVPKAFIEDQSRYEFFAGLNASGTETWSSSAASMAPVFQDPNGVMIPSVIYIPGLDRYILITCHTAWEQGNFGIFDAPAPWGPWTTVRYYSGWPAGGEAAQTSFYANLSPKWLSPSGTEFVFVFTGTANDAWNSVPGSFVLLASDSTAPDASSDLRAAP